MNPQGSFTAVEAPASQVVGSVPSLDVFAAPVRQEQTVAKQDRVQLCSLVPDVRAPVPLIQEECGRCQSVPEGSFLELLAKQIVDAPCPQEELMYATENELTVAAPADELAPDVELDEARQRFRLRRVFDAALAERTAQELLQEEDAAPQSAVASPIAKKVKKDRHKK